MIPQLSFYQYRPVYQGAPIEEAQQAFAMGAQAYDTNLENFNKLESFGASLRALPQDQEYLKQKLAGTNAAVKHIADQTTGSKRWDLAGDALQRMKSSFQNDSKLGAIRESYLNFAEGEKIKQEMRAKGQTPFEITDINQHRSFDDQGNINIFRPDIRPKADYVAEATDIWKNIAPDIYEAKLQPSEVEGILSGQTIRGISPEKLRGQLENVRNTYMNTDSGEQHKLFIQKNSPEKNPDKFINDFLFGIGSLRQFQEVKNERMVDPSYQWEQRTKSMLEINAAKEQMKRSSGRGNYDPDNERLFRIESLKAKGAVGEKALKANALMINSPEIIKGYKDVIFTGDGSRIVPLNKSDKSNYNFEGDFWNDPDKILSFTPKGFALDDAEGKDTVGGIIGEAVIEDGDKKKTINVVVKNPDENMRSIFDVYQNTQEAIRNNKAGRNNKGQGYVINDVSGLFDYTDKKVALRVRADNRIVPVLQKADGGYRPPKQDEAEALYLKEYYSPSDIQGLMIDKIAKKLKPVAETAKQVTE